MCTPMHKLALRIPRLFPFLKAIAMQPWGAKKRKQTFVKLAYYIERAFRNLKRITPRILNAQERYDVTSYWLVHGREADSCVSDSYPGDPPWFFFCFNRFRFDLKKKNQNTNVIMLLHSFFFWRTTFWRTRASDFPKIKNSLSLVSEKLKTKTHFS